MTAPAPWPGAAGVANASVEDGGDVGGPPQPKTPAEARATYLSGLDPDDELQVRRVAEKAGISDDDYVWVVLDGVTRATNLQIASSERIAVRTIKALEQLDASLPKTDVASILASVRQQVAADISNMAAEIASRKISKVLSDSVSAFQTATTENVTAISTAKHRAWGFALARAGGFVLLGAILAHFLGI